MPHLLRAADAEVLAGGSITLLAELGAPAGGPTAVNRSLLPEGAPGVGPHRHAVTTELFLVLGGGLRALAGEAVVELGVGDALVAEPGLVHALAPGAGTHADLLIVSAGAPERFAYYRLLDRVLAGVADPAELRASGPRFDNEFVSSAAWPGS